MARVELIKTVKPVGNTGHAIIPKRYLGKKVKIIIEDDGEDEKEIKKKIISFLKDRKKAKILTTFYISGFSLYSDFIRFIDELEKKGIIKRDENYLKYIEG